MRKKSFKSKILMSVLLLTIILFTQCKKDSSQFSPTGTTETTTASTSSLATTSPTLSEPVSINLTSVQKETGYAYYISFNFGTPGDTEAAPSSSILKIYENGKELGPAHSAHKDIRAIGVGRFSHWGNILYFTSSDNSDPRTNGRKYTYTIGTSSTTTTTTTTSPTLTTQSTINLSSVQKETGYAYYMSYNFGTPGDTEASPSISILKIYENGNELGPAHSAHRDIRASGVGRFSHWGNILYFTSSDNSDPRTNGRKYTYSIGSTSSTTTTTTTAPTTTTPTTTTTTTTAISSTSPIGYAMVNGSTTGGKGGQTVTVSNLTDFKNAASSTSPLIIQVSGNFTGTGMMDVANNKTIIGLSGATLNGIGLAMYGKSNIIIKNLKINNVVGADGITIKQASHHIWVDHCEIWQDRTHGWDYYDELLEVTDRSDYVTISNNIFHDTHKALLIGSGDLQTTDIGHLKVTLYGNYFYNVSERQPRTRFGYMHVFNNYFLNGSGYTIGVSMDATVRTDNNYFEGQAIPIYTALGAKPGFVSGASTNFYKNSGTNQITTAASSWVPEYEYKSVLIPAADVAARVLSQAGPKY